MGQCTEFKAVPGYGLSCKVSGIEELIKPKPVTDKNKKNLSVNICGAVIDESSDIHTTSVISGNDNGEFILELESQQKLSMVDSNSQIFPISLQLTRDSKKSPKSKSPPPPSTFIAMFTMKLVIQVLPSHKKTCRKNAGTNSRCPLYRGGRLIEVSVKRESTVFSLNLPWCYL